MIDWIIGGFIVVATILIVISSIKRLKSGKGGCNCGGCDPTHCSHPDKKC